MVKYKKCLDLLILTWIMFFILLGICISCAYTWKFNEFLILLCIFEVPTIIAFPLVYQTIKFDNNKISLELWFIKLRTFLWSEVHEVGIAYTRGRGYANNMYIEMIYISKRPVMDKERFNILEVKDRKNFITMEKRGHIVEDIKQYSNLPFHSLPSKDEFDNK